MRCRCSSCGHVFSSENPKTCPKCQSNSLERLMPMSHEESDGKKGPRELLEIPKSIGHRRDLNG